MSAITEKEVCQAVRCAAPNKALDPDYIPNLTLHRALAIALPKVNHGGIAEPGKPDYTEPKAYRPIALLDTIEKVLEAVIATRLSYMVGDTVSYPRLMLVAAEGDYVGTLFTFCWNKSIHPGVLARQ
ncbi:uncharacterized protein EURHEDRAFT_550554 [Aspergillus ruber CBS 135680]|uniref:Uncharacterized protein n=1 Tax=Aspergillus ruber (strain CBS 135680) TaxID=1388766 RepID=A0A017S007_ASPRC|nr:uncharacterized protein EURHEDRAFT_550554 [Aspergillus ruber CBS 135680]EYE90277.1 hypothetical protein EURHEDRAFT_550554 [Aspergillus ruber CBS 135680]